MTSRPLALRFVDALAGTTPTRPLAAARIVFAVAALMQAPITWGVLRRIADPRRVDLPMFAVSPPASLGLYGGVMAAWVAAAVLFAIGLRTRAAGIVLALTMFAAVAADQQSYSNHLYLMSLVATLLAMADSGAAWSIDARRRGARESAPRWPVVLVLAQLSIVYGVTGAVKLNPEFLGGDVVRTVMPQIGALEAVSWKLMMGTSILLSIVTVVGEVLLAVGMWRRAWRPALFVIGFAIHAGIATFMSAHLGLTVFGLAMFAMYLPLVDAPPRSRVVIWDDTCSACAVWVRWFRRLDWFRIHDFRGSSDAAVLARHGLTREAADQALQLFGEDGHHAGFAAVGRILEVLPATCWFAAAFRLPVVRAVGARGYARYAMQRSCAVPERTPMAG